ncbi:hypothetical protein G3T14_16720 [Methylobacterium sp. BTF04]|uniref:BrnT family toxin n=1 Tax=Methylobacterium sp. BTF04 TaxID=2708300 RepID=UPI0013D6F525|nr:BrnT family toxin [Methylobacterium sp. BTF04]NEU13763.1 hypothetical protein [Methylobacterium sp. BTF04]
MLIVWDELKRETNLAKHGLDFADFSTRFDFEAAVQVDANAVASGPARFKLIGEFEGRLVVAAILAPLGTEALALISLRRASRRERSFYDEA